MKTAISAILFLLSLPLITAQTTLEGKVTDASTGASILFGSVALYKNGVLLTGEETDLNGNYLFSEIDPGIYDFEASYIGYTPQRINGVQIKKDQRNRLNFALSEGVLMDAVEVINCKVPMIEVENTTSGSAITGIYSKRKSAKDISTLGIATHAEAPTKPSRISMRSSRSDKTMYYVDGVRKTSKRVELPSSGQLTAGEWNDLHNWKDWNVLLQEENYSIMMERYAIYPNKRYSVLVLNEENEVLSNVPVQLLDTQGDTIWSTFTDNAGKAELWENAFGRGQKATAIQAGDKMLRNITTIDEGSNTIVLTKSCSSPKLMDIVFVVDATSSMNDEIAYLKAELLDVIWRIEDTNEDIDFNLGSVFYRDIMDDYLTRVLPLSSDPEDLVDFVHQQGARGGGDTPEAVDHALAETLQLSWREDALKLAFLILDAPPHENEKTMNKIRTQIKAAAEKGIKLIPITASGINRNTEFLMKFMAILTNGTYVFITDHSGIGNTHLDPVVKDYEVEKLNDCIVRLLIQYSKPYACQAPTHRSNTGVEVSIFPNPSTQFVNVQTSTVVDKINIYSANGMLVKSISPDQQEVRIELGDLVNGIYNVSVFYEDQVETRQIILLK